jgi:hypothetical protein
MNIRNFGIVSNPQQRGIHLYGVLLVRLTSHVYTTEDLTDLVNEVITAIFEIYSHEIRILIVHYGAKNIQITNIVFLEMTI